MFDAVVNELSERYGLGDRARELFGLLMGYIFNDRRGGFGGFVEAFREQGHGDLVSSWLGSPEGEHILNAGDVGTVFGQGLLNDWSNRLGTSRATLAAAIAGVLPRLIAELTPGGRLPGGIGTVVPYDSLPAGDRRSDLRERSIPTSPAVRDPRQVLADRAIGPDDFGREAVGPEGVGLDDGDRELADPSVIDPALAAESRVVEPRVGEPRAADPAAAPMPPLRMAGAAPSFESLRTTQPATPASDPAPMFATPTTPVASPAAPYAGPATAPAVATDPGTSRADAMAAAMASPADLAPDSAANWQFRRNPPRRRRGGGALFWIVLLLLLGGGVYYAWWAHLLDPYIAQIQQQLG